jgi:hypothetical protein
VRAVGLGFVFAFLAACSSASDCPTYAPGSGQACTGDGTCAYGILSCVCDQEIWQCELPFSPDVSDGDSDGQDDNDSEDIVEDVNVEDVNVEDGGAENDAGNDAIYETVGRDP